MLWFELLLFLWCVSRFDCFVLHVLLSSYSFGVLFRLCCYLKCVGLICFGGAYIVCDYFGSLLTLFCFVGVFSIVFFVLTVTTLFSG